MNKNRWLVITILAMLLSVCLAFVACDNSGKNNNSSEEDTSATTAVLSSLTLTGADDLTMLAGETLTAEKLAGVKAVAAFTTGNPVEYDLSATLPSGMSIDKLGKTLEEGENTVTVSYLFGGITKQATFTVTVESSLPEGVETLESIPEGALTLNVTVGSKDYLATGVFAFSYGETALDVTAYVTDEIIYTESSSIYTRDSVEIVLDKVIRQKGYTDNTVSVIVDANGNVLVKGLAAQTTIAESGVEATASLFTLDGKKVNGYKLAISIPYTLVDAQKEDCDLAVEVGLTNAYNATIQRFAYSNQYGENYANVYTFAHVTAEGTLEANKYVNYGYIWGNGGAHLNAGSSWNLDYDDGTDEAYIKMTSNDYLDNNIYMFGSNVEKYYAQVSLKVDGAKTMSGGNYDQYPKFGIIVKNANDTAGFAYYVDAVSDPSNGNILAGSTQIGFNTRSNGWDGKWSNIGQSVGANASVYQNDFITFGLYRDGNIFVLYYNGAAVHTYVAELGNDGAYFGLFSFNLMLTAKDYMLVTDEEALAEYGIKADPVDYLFMGDSYIDTAFWYNYENQFGALSAANIGVGGTKIPYWVDNLSFVKMKYVPANIIVHIGVNDIDDSNLTGAQAYSELEEMLNLYHTTFPEANIYYVNICKNMLFKGKHAAYATLNAAVKNLAATTEWLYIIDMDAAITEDAEGSTQHWYSADGLHYGVDGYGLFNAKVCEALGIERPEELGETGLGDVAAEGAPEFSYSAGWTLENGVAHNAGTSYNRIGAESQIFVNGLYASDFFAEVELSIGDCYCQSDEWAKTGIAIRTANYTYFYFINTSSVNFINPGRTADGHVIYRDLYGNLFYRPEEMGNGKTWSREMNISYFYLGGTSFDHYTDNSFKKLGIAKIGNTIVLFADGYAIQAFPNTLLGAEEKASVSVFTFNMDVYAKNATYTTDADEIAAKMGNVTLDGKLDEAFWTEEVLANAMTFGEKSDGRKLEVVAAKSGNGVAMGITVYSYWNERSSFDSTNWFINANVEFRFGSIKDQRYLIFQGAGFDNIRGCGSSMVVATAAKPELVDQEKGVYKTLIEVFVPVQAFTDYTLESEELPVWIWGYIFDNEGWQGIMSDGTWPLLTASAHGLRFTRNVSIAPATGATITSTHSVARHGDEVTITVAIEEGYELDSFTMNGKEVALDEEGKYTFTMPDEDVAFAATFKGRYSVDLTAVDGKITTNTTPLEGDVITFTSNENWIINKLYIDGEELAKDENGNYTLTVTKNIVVTADTSFTADGFVMDGKFDGAAYGEQFGFKVEGNRDIEIWAVKGASGMWVYLVAHTNSTYTESPDWWRNYNFEFTFNDGDQKYVALNGMNNGVTSFVKSSEILEEGKFAGKYEHILEIYVEKKLVANWSDTAERVKVSYAFKYGDSVEKGRFEGESLNVWPRDSYMQSVIGAYANRRLIFGSTQESHPDNLFATENGLMTTSPLPTKATLDGNFAEFEGKTSVTLGNENAKFVISGFTAEDGTYLAFTIYQKNIAASTEEWHLNDNIEIRNGNHSQYDEYRLGFSIFDGFIVACYENKGAMVRTELTEGEWYDQGYRYQTNVEYYIPYIKTEACFNFGINGNGFGGWQALAWDNSDVYVTANGVSNGALTYDGEFNEAIWTNDVLSKTFTATADGANVTFAGVRTAYGVALAVTFKHNKAITEHTQGNGNGCWDYMGPEFRFNGNIASQFAVTTWGNTTQNGMRFGAKTVENEEGSDYKYTTTYEITCSSPVIGTTEKVSVQFAGVYENGFRWLFNDGAWGNWTHYITTTGMEAIA